MNIEQFKIAEKSYKKLSKLNERRKRLEDLLSSIDEGSISNPTIKISSSNDYYYVELSKDLAIETMRKQIYRIKNLISKEQKTISNL
jgi:hypothetical protein